MSSDGEGGAGIYLQKEGNRVEVDGTYVNEPLSGLGRRGGAMPRASHRSGNDAREHGISNMKACVVCGVSESGDELLELCDRCRPSDKALTESLKDKVGGAKVVTDALQGYGRVLPGLGTSSHEVHKEVGVSLGRVNALYKRHKDFIGPFNGVSTRYIDMYTHWFRYTEYLRNSKGDDLESMLGLAADGRYFLTRSAPIERERPFWDYWEGKPPKIGAEPIWGPDAAWAVMSSLVKESFGKAHAMGPEPEVVIVLPQALLGLGLGHQVELHAFGLEVPYLLCGREPLPSCAFRGVPVLVAAERQLCSLI